MFRRSRFHDLVQRQLDLFAADESALLEEVADADAAWTGAAREETEERYGDYQLVVDAIGERLHDLREGYAATLQEPTDDEYRAAFDTVAAKRFPRFASFLEDDS
jgi:hypothetical protein